jgi:hypothetical protein
MQADWTKQVERTRPDLIEPIPFSKLQAKGRLRQYLDQRECREKTLTSVLESNGIKLERTRESIVEATRFFINSASPGEEGREFSANFIEFLWNLGQFIGTCAIDWSFGSKLKWIVEDIAVPGTNPRFVFRISGYAGTSESFDPDLLLLQVARAKLEGHSVSELIVVAQLNRIIRLCRS